MMDLSTKYTYCKASGISSDMLLKGADFPHLEYVKKGLILELLNPEECWNNPMGKVCTVDSTTPSVRGSSIRMGFEKISSGTSVQEAETSKVGDKTA